MKGLRRFIYRLRGVFSGRRAEDEMREEFTAHVEMWVEDNIRTGMGYEEAKRAAALRFGTLASAQEAYRDQRGLPALDALGQDLRYGVRILARNPGITATAVITLALGIGGTTAIFSIVHGVLLRELPYRDSDRIVTLWERDLKSNQNDRVAFGNFADWRSQSTQFSFMAIAEPFSHELTGEGEPETFNSYLVSEGFFEAAGASFALGRGFISEDYRMPPSPEGYAAGSSGEVVVITHGLWTRRFGGDPDIVRRKINFRGRPTSVAGVLAPGFELPAKRDLYAPRIPTAGDARDRVRNFRFVIARLRPGAGIEAARLELDAIGKRAAQEFPRSNENIGVAIVPLAKTLTGDARSSLFVLLGAVGFVLLIACANVANLMLARGAERGHEFAVRRAIGASGNRILRQVLTESALLSAGGAVIGVALAAWILNAVRRFGPASIPRLDQLELNSSLLTIALAAAVVTITAGRRLNWL
ncbi:MAG: ABC transporter permease [Bryobacteraceae bacterium]